jgi:N-methylhydantoinase A
MENYRISVDVGGTFTDLIALNEEDCELINIKVLTTPKEPAVGIISALGDFFKKYGKTRVSMIIHATTIATNALTGQLGLELPKTALITTKGFKDVVEIGRQRRHELYNLFIQRPKPLILRRHRYCVNERIDANGEVIKTINSEEIQEISRKITQENIEAVAIGFLNSYINPEHEFKVKMLIEECCKEVFVTTSYEISPEYREYERFSTGIVNACLLPIISSYVTDLIEKVKGLGLDTQLYVMQSSGGIASGDNVKRIPACIIESGPAAGVIGAAFYGKLLDLDNILSFDMGGTTAKAGLIKDNITDVVTEYEVGGQIHSGRIVKGSGYPVRFPFIDLSECSSGGGTIAWIDAGGALRVGPISAGAEPGPACYGLGGVEPTITDANLILGRLNPDYLLGGRMKLRRDLSEKTMTEKICKVMDIDILQASSGVIKISNSAMSKILRIVSVERGYDPRDFTLVAFGGAGPMHACALAEDLGIKKIVIPLNPGLFSALGMLAADFTHYLSFPIIKDVEDIGSQFVEEKYHEMEDVGRNILAKERSTFTNSFFIRYADMRYKGQAYELTVNSPNLFTDDSISGLVESFHNKHRSVFGFSAKENVELINLRSVSVGVTKKPKIHRKKNTEEGSSSVPSTFRDVFFEEFNEHVSCPVYIREQLSSHSILYGPCIVEQYDTTTVVYPTWKGVVDRYGSLILKMNGESVE